MDIRVSRTPHGPFERILFRLNIDADFNALPLTAEVSVYRLGDLLIDTGSAHVNRALIHALKENPPEKIVLTHQHEDHAGGVVALIEAFGDLPVYAPRKHIDIIESTDSVPSHRALFWGRPRAPKNLIPYDPGDTFETRGLVVESIETPGHTPGHISLVTRWGRQCFVCTGDLYFGKRFVPAWFESAADDLVSSQRHIASLDREIYMLPTHGKTRADGSRVLIEAADRIEREARTILKLSSDKGDLDLKQLCRKHFKGDDRLGQQTGGEISELAFVRSVLQPVRSLPAASLAKYFPPEP